MDDSPLGPAVGDTLGTLNTLFSGLAFAVLFFALWLQSHELTLQREQLKAQLIELDRNTKELGRTADAQAGIESLQVEQLRTLAVSAALHALNDMITSERARLSSLIASENSDPADHYRAIARQESDKRLEKFVKERDSLLNDLRRAV